MRYAITVIQSFADRDTRAIFEWRRVAGFPQDVQIRAQRKLAMLDSIERLEHLRVIPGNRLERLRGDREGQHSIRVNDQWRICFAWVQGDAYDVELVDYHS